VGGIDLTYMHTSLLTPPPPLPSLGADSTNFKRREQRIGRIERDRCLQSQISHPRYTHTTHTHTHTYVDLCSSQDRERAPRPPLSHTPLPLFSAGSRAAARESCTGRHRLGCLHRAAHSPAIDYRHTGRERRGRSSRIRTALLRRHQRGAAAGDSRRRRRKFRITRGDAEWGVVHASGPAEDV